MLCCGIQALKHRLHLLIQPEESEFIPEGYISVKKRFLFNRRLCSSATDSKETTETEEPRPDIPAHILQTRGMGTPVMEEPIPGTMMDYNRMFSHDVTVAILVFKGHYRD